MADITPEAVRHNIARWAGRRYGDVIEPGEWPGILWLAWVDWCHGEGGPISLRTYLVRAVKGAVGRELRARVIPAPRRKRLRGAWARSHARCRVCGTTERPHAGRGLCRRCASRERYRRRVLPTCFSRLGRQASLEAEPGVAQRPS